MSRGLIEFSWARAQPEAMTPHLKWRAARVRPLTAVVLLATLMASLAGCDSSGSTIANGMPTGGVQANDGSTILSDVWIDAPHGARARADTGIRLYVDNDSHRPDAIVGVSTPLARTVEFMSHGHRVARIPVPPGQGEDLEWRHDRDGIELVHLRHTIERGQWYPVTFTFAHSPAVTMQITVAPLGPARPGR
jgi:copper(I)-binding protein